MNSPNPNEMVASRFYLLAAIPFLLTLPDGWVFDSPTVILLSISLVLVNLVMRFFQKYVSLLAGRLVWLINTGSAAWMAIIYFEYAKTWTAIIWIAVAVLFGLLTAVAFRNTDGGRKENAGTN